MTRLMPAMSDARAFTSYVSAGQREEALQHRLGARNENEYRHILQANFKAVHAMQATFRPVVYPQPMSTR